MDRMPRVYRQRMEASKLALARKMRKEPTPAEAALWERVRGKQLGVPVRRQAPMLGWIADFYVPAWNLVIELDGAHHSFTREQDFFRDQRLGSLGFAVLRFDNREVLENTDRVVERIRAIGLTRAAAGRGMKRLRDQLPAGFTR